jgi:hypothetical protein
MPPRETWLRSPRPGCIFFFAHIFTCGKVCPCGIQKIIGFCYLGNSIGYSRILLGESLAHRKDNSPSRHFTRSTWHQIMIPCSVALIFLGLNLWNTSLKISLNAILPQLHGVECLRRLYLIPGAVHDILSVFRHSSYPHTTLAPFVVGLVGYRSRAQPLHSR